MALMNYTGRESIARDLIMIEAKKNAPVLTVYLKSKQDLKDNPKFKDCQVVLDAVLRTRAQRMELGSLVDLPASKEVAFSDFQPGEEVKFRLKIVDPGDKKIIGEVSGLRVKSDKQDDPILGKKKTLLPVNWAAEGDEMKGQFWKLDYSNGNYPVLLLAKGKFTALGDVNLPVFRALAFPAIMKEVLTFAFVTKFDNIPAWAADWDKLATLLGCDPCPQRAETANAPQEVEEHFENVCKWIDDVSAQFAHECHLESITSEFKGSAT